MFRSLSIAAAIMLMLTVVSCKKVKIDSGVLENCSFGGSKGAKGSKI